MLYVPPTVMSDVSEYISALKGSEKLGRLVVHHETFAEISAKYGALRRPLPVTLERALELAGIQSLYSHQCEAIDRLRAGRHVVLSAPTAGGKTLVYNLPVLETALGDPDAKALYLFPLKALAQDQQRSFRQFTAAFHEQERPEVAVYDGDTSSWFRKKIREQPPQVLMSNPEMLHLSILPHHASWAAFWAGLRHIVVDEAHTYRGVLGSHMAQVFRRTLRMARRYGSSPGFVFLSATLGNPVELAENLTGLSVDGVVGEGAPRGKRHFVFVNPAVTMEESPSAAAIQLLKAALARGLRTIVYAQSRKMTELIAMWAEQRSGEYAGRISAYRAGFLSEERRDIEARMASGDLVAVVSTSALELGIDIGGLDLCILVGYPGSVMSTLQRGGRVGRSMRESAVILVAGEDALDQYFMKRPAEFFTRPPESAVVNPANPDILTKHLECAAAEHALLSDEPWLAEEGVSEAVHALELKGKLLRGKDGMRIHARRKRPHREINLRGTGNTFRIVEAGLIKTDDAEKNERSIGVIDEHRAYKETHPGAVYIHRGKTYVVQELDITAGSVQVQRAGVDYFTRPRGEKQTEILDVQASKTVFGTRVHFGRLKVTDTVTGYEKRRTRGQKLLTVVPLDLPPLTFETEGLWFEIPRQVQRAAEDDLQHFMGGIHAAEHAAIGIMPLLILTDRNDLGGISTPYHPQMESAAVFVYDGVPGGVGLCKQAFAKAEELIDKTLAVIESCTCDTGCPSCVHSPKCGSGNRPIDKAAAAFVLQAIKGGSPPEDPCPPHVEALKPKTSDKPAAEASAPMDYAVLDVETRLSAAEVGGWNNAGKMGVSCAVLYTSRDDAFTTYLQDDIPALYERLHDIPLIVGFNIKRFDYEVLSGVAGDDFHSLPTLDMLEVVHGRLGYRLSLDGLASATLGTSKSADGLQALAWWKEGKLDQIIEYCTRDVAVTRDLYIFGKEHGYLLFTNKAKSVVRLPVEW